MATITTQRWLFFSEVIILLITSKLPKSIQPAQYSAVAGECQISEIIHEPVPLLRISRYTKRLPILSCTGNFTRSEYHDALL